MLTAGTLIAGLVLLTIGAELLVRAASALAIAVRVSPLVVGLTIVAYGTSTPELIVSVQSALRGQADIALGNVIGSNIFNVLFILGISALIVPLSVSQRLVRLDVPLMIGLSVLVAGMGIDRVIGLWDGLVLMAGLVIYTIWGVVMSRREPVSVEGEYARNFESGSSTEASVPKLVQNVFFIVLGLILLFYGSRWFTDSSIAIARQMGLSELVIGLTIVAAGTSLPEVATSIMAALRGERDIAVGNVVGSNIFNIMGVLGVSSVVSNEGVSVSAAALSFDIPMMIAVSIACFPIFLTGHRIGRWEGAFFLLYFCAYTAYLISAEITPVIERRPTLILFGFLLPLVVISIAVPHARKLRSDR